MGTSTNGMLVFGIDLGEERPEFLGDDIDIDFDDVIAAWAGLKEPEHQDFNKDWPEYWEAERTAVAACPIELIEYCSYEYPMYILAARGAVRLAHRGFPKAIDPAELTVPGWQIDALREFCEKHGIEWQEPRWYLCSMWG